MPTQITPPLLWFIYLLIAMLALGCTTKTVSVPEVDHPTPVMKTAIYVPLPANPQGIYYGFNIYRAEDEEGPFQRINEKIIPGTQSGQKYVDQDVTAGRTYYYYTEGVTYQGERKRLTPLVPVYAIAPPETTPQHD